MPRKIQVMSSDGSIYDVMGENAKQFEKETRIKVSFTIYAPHVYFRALQRRCLHPVEAADIFLMQSTRWYLGSEIDPEKSCIDLTAEEWTKRLKTEWLPAVSYKGRVYGLIVWDDTLGWVYTYNDKIFRRLGLSAPRTYEEFVAVCERIKQAGIVPIYEPGASRWHTSLTFFEMGSTFEQNSPDLYERLNTNRLKFADYPPFRQALGQILFAANRGFFGSDFMANTIEGSKTALISGAAAMTLNKIGFARSVLKARPRTRAPRRGGCSRSLARQPNGEHRTLCPHLVRQREEPGPRGSSAVLPFPHPGRQPLPLRCGPARRHEPVFSRPAGPASTQRAGVPELRATWGGAIPGRGQVSRRARKWMEIEADFESMWPARSSPGQFLSGVDARRANMAAAARDPAWPKSYGRAIESLNAEGFFPPFPF